MNKQTIPNVQAPVPRNQMEVIRWLRILGKHLGLQGRNLLVVSQEIVLCFV